MKKHIKIPKGKDVVGLSVNGHSYVRLIDSSGNETFRFESPGKHITAVVCPGNYTVETDGKLGRIDLASMGRLRDTAEFNAMKPPTARR